MANIIKIGGGGSGSAVLIPKTITANGVYSASSDSADGYNEVTVNVENGGFIPVETWIINSKSATFHPTTTAHFVYNNGLLTGYDVADNAGNETVTMGDISTFIGDASSFNWWVTANANMTYRLFDVINGTLGTLQTATIGTKIISDGTIADPYCIEIRRYS